MLTLFHHHTILRSDYTLRLSKRALSSTPITTLRTHGSLAMSSATSADEAVPTADAPRDKAEPPLVMQVVVRRDLLDAEGWGVGPLMAQVAHATAAVLHETRELSETQTYLEDLKNMRKAVLQTNSEESLRKLSTLLTHATPPVPHHMWIEQPENVPTCIALAPNHRDSRIKKALDKSGSRLWKG